jgi:hypothetical protein
MPAHSIADDKSLREFGLLAGGFAAGVFGLLLPWVFGRPHPLWPWVVGSALVGLALAAPWTLRPVFKAWACLGALLGWFNTRLLMGLVFFLLLTPTALVLRILGHDPLAMRLDRAARTYRVPSRKTLPKQMERPF